MASFIHPPHLSEKSIKRSVWEFSYHWLEVLVFVSSLLCEEHCTPIQKTEEFLSISSISTPVSLLAVSDIATAFNYSETILRREVDWKKEFSVSKGSSLSWESLSLKIFQFSYILTFTLKQPNRRINKVWNKMGRGAEIRSAHSPRLNGSDSLEQTSEKRSV